MTAAIAALAPSARIALYIMRSPRLGGHMSEISEVQDDQPRVAAERWARMRRKLVESALLVFAENGYPLH
jgi:hypothetical protein